jgi:PAS domain-containing protein
MNLGAEANAVNRSDTTYYHRRQERTDEHSLESNGLGQAVLILDENGTIRDCSGSCTSLLGYRNIDLVTQPVSRVIPQASGVGLIENGKINPLLKFLCRCGYIFHARRLQGDKLPCRLSLVRLKYSDNSILRLIVDPVGQVDFTQIS